MDITRLWKSVLAEIELSVSKATYQTHFANSLLLSTDGDVVSVGFPSPIMRTLAETRYYSLIKSILDNKTGRNTSLVFSVLPKKETSSSLGPLFSQTATSETPSAASVARRYHISPDPLLIILQYQPAISWRMLPQPPSPKVRELHITRFFFMAGWGWGKRILCTPSQTICLQGATFGSFIAWEKNF